MNLSQNHFVPQFLPPQMVNSALLCTEPTSFVGKVIRIRPNIYVFVCDYCASQHQNIDSFLHHTELHFQLNETPSIIPSAMAPARSNQNPSTAPIPTGTSINPNNSTVAPFPVELQQSQLVPMNEESNGTDEVYEIIDLGYDFEGISYPNAKNIDEVSIVGNGKQRPKPKSKQQRSPSKSKVQRPKPKIQRPNAINWIEPTNENTSTKCPFCVRNFSSVRMLKQHMNSSHAKIFKKIVSQKKAFKCKICGHKFPKPSHTLEDAQQHLKSHYGN